MWYAKVDGKLKGTPTRDELHEEIHKVQDKVMSELAPIRESVIRTEEKVSSIFRILDEKKK